MFESREDMKSFHLFLPEPIAIDHSVAVNICMTCYLHDNIESKTGNRHVLTRAFSERETIRLGT